MRAVTVRHPGGVDQPAFAEVPAAQPRQGERLIRVRAGETVLIHSGGSGVGTAAIQLANSVGAAVLSTTGTTVLTVKEKKYTQMYDRYTNPTFW